MSLTRLLFVGTTMRSVFIGDTDAFRSFRGLHCSEGIFRTADGRG